MRSRGKPVHHNREIPWGNVISYKKEALQEEMSFGGPREICWVTLWVGLKQSSEPQKGQDRVFKDLRQDYWLFFLKQPPSCSERVAEEVFSGPRIAFGSHLPPGLFVRDFSQPSAPLHICPFWCPSFFSIFFGPEDTKNEFVFLPDNCILEKQHSPERLEAAWEPCPVYGVWKIQVCYLVQIKQEFPHFCEFNPHGYVTST